MYEDSHEGLQPTIQCSGDLYDFQHWSLTVNSSNLYGYRS